MANQQVEILREDDPCHVADGHTFFGTGGASSNTASLAMNKRVGYALEPLWLTLAQPVIGQENPAALPGEH